LAKKPDIKLVYLTPSELPDNPKNWREHPDSQIALLEKSLSDVGWAGACLYNKTTNRLIDGHARKEVSDPDEKIPVLIGEWTEEEEDFILATLDPIAALASVNEEQLNSLAENLDDEVKDMLEKLYFDDIDLDMEGLGDDFSLQDGIKEPFQQMTFVLADEQAEFIKARIKEVQQSKRFEDCPTFGNDNKNGNALFFALGG